MPYRSGLSSVHKKHHKGIRSLSKKHEVVGKAEVAAMDAAKAQTAYVEGDMSKAKKEEKAALKVEKEVEKIATGRVKKPAESAVKALKTAVKHLSGGETEVPIAGGETEVSPIAGGEVPAIEGGEVPAIEGGELEGGELEGGKRGVAKMPVAKAAAATKKVYRMAVEQKSGHILGQSMKEKERRKKRSASRSPMGEDGKRRRRSPGEKKKRENHVNNARQEHMSVCIRGKSRAGQTREEAQRNFSECAEEWRNRA